MSVPVGHPPHASPMSPDPRRRARPRSHRIGTKAAQTGTQTAAIVVPEGGGTANPTLGGGCGVMAETGLARTGPKELLA